MTPIQIDTNLHCLVFSTNVDDNLKAARLIYFLEHTEGVENWNLDMDDWQHVLRIDFRNAHIPELLSQLEKFDITLQEMEIW